MLKLKYDSLNRCFGRIYSSLVKFFINSSTSPTYYSISTIITLVPWGNMINYRFPVN